MSTSSQMADCLAIYPDLHSARPFVWRQTEPSNNRSRDGSSLLSHLSLRSHLLGTLGRIFLKDQSEEKFKIVRGGR